MKPQITIPLVLIFWSCQAYAAECVAVKIPNQTDMIGESESQIKKPRHGVDEDGVHIFDYGSMYNNLGKWHNPFFISNYSNLLYRDYVLSNCHNEDAKRKFMIQADFLLKSAEIEGNAAVWRYPFEYPEFDLKPGWISGIGQSRIAGTLFRAYAITGDPKYVDLARKALDVYRRPIQDGGVMVFEGGTAWIEEHPSSTGEPQKVLNGHITGCFGIQDNWQITLEEELRILVEKCLSATKMNLPKFDAGWTSYYALHTVNGPMPAEHGGYNDIHISQLRVLHEMTGDTLFAKWADRFALYESLEYSYSADLIENPAWPPAALSGEMAKGFARSILPAVLEIEAKKSMRFRGFALETGASDRMPQKAVLFAMIDGEWQKVAMLDGADSKSVKMEFKPIETSKFKLEILESGSKGFIHLKAAVPILDLPPI